jgi:hypothetical protein
MQTSFIAMVFCLCAVGLGGCDKGAPVAPMPTANQSAPADSVSSAQSEFTPSVPPAELVFPPGSATQEDAKAQKSDATRRPAQESTGGLMPGQNNDHSAPLPAAK